MVGCSLPSERCAPCATPMAPAIVSTATLEARAEWVLGGRVDDALWDLPEALVAPGARRSARLVAGDARVAARATAAAGCSAAASDCDLVLGDDDAVSRRTPRSRSGRGCA